MKHEKIKITKNMRKAELYENCLKLLEANYNLSVHLEKLEQSLIVNLSDAMALSRSLYFVLHHFKPKEALIELNCEGESDLEVAPAKKTKNDLVAYQ